MGQYEKITKKNKKNANRILNHSRTDPSVRKIAFLLLLTPHVFSDKPSKPAISEKLPI